VIAGTTTDLPDGQIGRIVRLSLRSVRPIGLADLVNAKAQFIETIQSDLGRPVLAGENISLPIHSKSVATSAIPPP
jgi:hypothetical protein